MECSGQAQVHKWVVSRNGKKSTGTITGPGENLKNSALPYFSSFPYPKRGSIFIG